MAATLGGMMRAPIMAVMFAFELTQDVNALLPLLTASVVAYGFTVMFMPRSILTEKIARRGYHIYREYGIDPLERHFVEEVMTQSVQSIDVKLTLAEALERYFSPSQKYRAFPAVRDGSFVGMVDRDTLLAGEGRAMERVGDLFGVNVPIMALRDETCRTVATRLAVHGLERVPVVTDPQSRRLIGIISRSDLVKPSLTLFDDEQQYETFRTTRLQGLKRRFSKWRDSP
jgi:CBS domain-containing protein